MKRNSDKPEGSESSSEENAAKAVTPTVVVVWKDVPGALHTAGTEDVMERKLAQQMQLAGMVEIVN